MNATRPPTVRPPARDGERAREQNTAASVRFGIRTSTQMNCVWISTRSSCGVAQLAALRVVPLEHLVAPAERLDHTDAAWPPPRSWS